MPIVKTAFIAAVLAVSASAACAGNDLLDNYHGNTQRPVMSQMARQAFAGPVVIREARTAQAKWVNPSSWEELARAAQ